MTNKTLRASRRADQIRAVLAAAPQQRAHLLRALALACRRAPTVPPIH